LLLSFLKKIIKVWSSCRVQFHFVPLLLKRREIERNLEIETGSENATVERCCIHPKAGEISSKLCI
jgi:hypothetical protein